MSEEFRRSSDSLLVATLDELGIPYRVVGGSVRERIQRIVDLVDLPLVMPIDQAVTSPRHHSPHR
ncbi:hypothetical protein [Thermocrispum sp.]|uniref:Uncharacterized protein n=1 Tax=Thermocrispum agreste TaxID=37925 RepID=A0A2W4J1N0_9PSEU|nr:hypothetical protein [Thermocrispum sp.]PZM93002.1 MAG: hypothetical protein DIU77_15510 [Thermocrispum agreste]